MRSVAVGSFILALAGCSQGDGQPPGADPGAESTSVATRATESPADATRACITGNPPGSPFDVGDVSVASPPPGSSGPMPAPPSASDIGDECVVSGGTGCDPAGFISIQAAACIATLNQFQAGLRPWSVALTFHHGHQRVVWNVTNELSASGSDGYGGQVLTIDATLGSVLETSAYRAIP